jgi:uncharacterized protein
MKSVFADSHYFIALLNPRDSGRQRAIEASKDRSGKLITTEWVLVEVGDAMAAPQFREKFAQLVDSLRTDQSVIIVDSSTVWFEKAIDLYRQRPDKQWSMTDCLSFVLMEERGLREALTADHHFEQAGFIATLRVG